MTRFTVQVSRAQRVGEARVSGINFVFDISGDRCWLLVLCIFFFFFFFSGEDFYRSRGDLLAFCICALDTLFVIYGFFKILFSFDSKFEIANQSHPFVPK